MIKNVFSVAKKEATNYSNVVTLTANTGISLNTSYQQAENSIKEILMSSTICLHLPTMTSLFPPIGFIEIPTAGR